MVIKNFDQLIDTVKRFDAKRRVAVAAAHDAHTLEAVFLAKENNIVEPILVGNEVKIRQILENLGKNYDDVSVIEAEDAASAAYKAVELVNSGSADFILKGGIQTGELLKAVVDKKRGLRTDSIMSHCAINEVPGYHKLLITTDGGMVMYPTLEQKRQIIENAVGVLLSLGYEKPKVAVLAAVETVNEKMPETIDAAKLKEWNQQGIIKDCVIEGPISYDLAVSKGASEAKGYASPVAGDADIFIVPNITAGNILGKSLVYLTGGKMAGFVVGARVPVALTSRGASTEEKYLSLVLSAASARHMQKSIL